MMQRVIERSKPKAQIVEELVRGFFTENKVDKALVVIKKFDSSRSGAQNRLYFAWCTHLGEFLGYEKDDCHSALADKFLGRKEYMNFDGDDSSNTTSTTTLKVAEFAHYLTQVERFAASEFGYMMPRTEDYHHAIGTAEPKYAD